MYLSFKIAFPFVFDYLNTMLFTLEYGWLTVAPTGRT